MSLKILQQIENAMIVRKFGTGLKKISLVTPTPLIFELAMQAGF